ncbi:hypothetical protein Ddye_029513 [Dipteronia dyeriana]|uniref:Uncharacterized protein n=1 Tax=Dipteronia dyeriana TaxID=168575 RepID=A0AAD9TEX9_9ROSI|nr:hypothetical protein Ddye_029513 [Dipteronia dyeriana]
MANSPLENTHVKLSSAVSIRRTQSNKIQNLVEYTHIPESAQINETSLPLLNPYIVFKPSKSTARKVTALVQYRPPRIKEYVQSKVLDNCLVLASTTEQYIDQEIVQPLIVQWIREGYSHLHIGAIRIVLTLYGRKGLPVTAIIALLNTIYTEYEHAVIGTYLSTLHAGSISLTYYPNFNIPLKDQNLHNFLKKSCLSNGSPIMRRTSRILLQLSSLIQSSPGYQIVPSRPPMRQSQPPTIEASLSAPPVFQVLMIRPVISEDDIPIHSFEADESPIYKDKINDNFIWDVDPDMCDADCECKACSKGIKSPCKPGSHHRKPENPNRPWTGLHPVKNKPLHIYDRAFQILRSERLLPDELEEPKKLLSPLPVSIPCFMAFSYDKDFPLLEPIFNHERNMYSRLFVQTTEILPNGSFKQPSRAEQVLNWHSRNARVHNRVLHSIDQKIDQVSHHVSQ